MVDWKETYPSLMQKGNILTHTPVSSNLSMIFCTGSVLTTEPDPSGYRSGSKTLTDQNRYIFFLNVSVSMELK